MCGYHRLTNPTIQTRRILQRGMVANQCKLFTAIVIYLSLFLQLLRESEKMFMRYISHEIRTPLNTVSMGLKVMETELLEGTLDPTKALKYVHEVQTATEVALTVLNDMLMLDKVKDGLLVLELTNEGPYALLRETVDGFNIQVQIGRTRLHGLLRSATEY